MAIRDFFAGLFKTKPTEEDMVQELIKSYKKRKELGLKDPVDTTVERIMELIYESDNPNERAEKILKAAIDEQEMPNRVAEKLSYAILKAEDLSDKAVSHAIVNSESDFSDKAIDKVLEEGDFRLDERLKLMSNVNDEAIIEARVLQEFDSLYNHVGKLSDLNIASRIERIQEVVRESDSDLDLYPHIERIFARKIAENFYNDNIRGTKLYAFSTIIPFSKMFADDMPSQVEEEFKLLEEQNEEKPDRYNVGILRNQLLSEIAKQVGTRFRDSKEIRENRRFIIPRSKMMEEISEEEKEYFIDKIGIYAGKQLSKKELKSINEQISGKISSKGTRASLIVAALDKMPDQDEAVEHITEIMSDPEKLSTVLLMQDMGLMDLYIRMSPERREKSFKIIKDTLASRIRTPGEKVTREPKKEVTPPKSNGVNKENSNEIEQR